MTPPTILIADDDRAIRTVLHPGAGPRRATRCAAPATPRRCGAGSQEGEGDLVITDVVMPDENGLDLVPRIRKLRPDLRVIVMSAQITLLTAVQATERGAFEYLPKPFDLSELIVGGRAARWRRRQRRCQRAPSRGMPSERLPLIGRSPAMQEIYRTIARLIDDRPHGADHRRIGHRQGTGGARAARLRQAPRAGRSSPSTWRRSRAS